MKEYKETPKEMSLKIMGLFSQYCIESYLKECAIIYIDGIIENAYIKWLMPEDINNPFLQYWNNVKKELIK